MRNALRLPGDADHAALVDLQHIRLQQHQALQATAAEADVVDGHQQSRRAQRAHRLDEVRRVADDLLLADLQAKRAGRQRRGKVFEQMMHGNG